MRLMNGRRTTEAKITVIVPFVFRSLWKLRLRLRLGVWFMWLAAKIIGCQFQVERRKSDGQEKEGPGEEE